MYTYIGFTRCISIHPSIYTYVDIYPPTCPTRAMRRSLLTEPSRNWWDGVNGLTPNPTCIHVYLHRVHPIYIYPSIYTDLYTYPPTCHTRAIRHFLLTARYAYIHIYLYRVNPVYIYPSIRLHIFIDIYPPTCQDTSDEAFPFDR